MNNMIEENINSHFELIPQLEKRSKLLRDEEKSVKLNVGINGKEHKLGTR